MDKQVKILIVDDDLELASNIQDVLEEDGYDPIIAENSHTAVNLCRDMDFDLAVIDIMLPDNSGVKLAEKLSKIIPQMEYIITTGYGSMDTAIEAVKQKRIMAYELKPVDMSRLLALIRQIIERRKVEGELRESSRRLEEMMRERSEEIRDARMEQVHEDRLATLGRSLESTSKELENPLGTISSSIRTLESKLMSADDNIQQHLLVIKLSAESASSIIRDRLSLGHILRPDLHTHNLMQIISESIARSRVSGEVNLINDFQNKNVLVDADRELLHIALRNVINSTVGATGNQGTLNVVIREAKGRDAQLFFTDAKPTMFQKEFEKFLRPLSTSSAEEMGAGMAMARIIVENHGGSIETGSDSGTESSFVIRLPINVEKTERVREHGQ
jgi:ActR/RegA family two-component response regulator